jgi:hypothetical protein
MRLCPNRTRLNRTLRKHDGLVCSHLYDGRNTCAIPGRLNANCRKQSFHLQADARLRQPAIRSQCCVTQHLEIGFFGSSLAKHACKMRLRLNYLWPWRIKSGIGQPVNSRLERKAVSRITVIAIRIPNQIILIAHK